MKTEKEIFQAQADKVLRLLGWVFLALLAVSSVASLFSQELPPPSLHLPQPVRAWNGAKTTGVALIVLGSVADGIVEGYEFDGRTSFERKFGASPTGPFGSLSWKSAYRERNPELGLKPGLTRWLGAFDFYHAADDLRWAGYTGGGVCFGLGMGKSKVKWKRAALEVAGMVIISSLSKRAGMYWIRN